MSKTPPTTDRFDELPADGGRIGAHRAENPRLRGGIVLLWVAAATVVLVALGVFGSLLATGRISFAPKPGVTPVVQQMADPVVDTSYRVLILNASGQKGLAGALRGIVLAAGWSPDSVTEGDAGASDFPTTTVYYAASGDEGAARGLAQAIGGADVQLNDFYQPVDDPDTADVDESALKQLVIVIGADRAGGAASTTAP